MTRRYCSRCCIQFPARRNTARAVALPVTRFGMEWSKGAAIADGVDRVYRMAAESLGALWHSPKK